MRWMKLQPIIQSEVSQKEKHQYSILTHIYGILKDGNNNPEDETAKETLRYRRVLWSQTHMCLCTHMHIYIDTQIHHLYQLDHKAEFY